MQPSSDLGSKCLGAMPSSNVSSAVCLGFIESDWYIRTRRCWRHGADRVGTLVDKLRAENTLGVSPKYLFSLGFRKIH